jgi:hypothetical protein
MKSRRSAAVRLAASAMLAAVVTLGAHAFVPTAFGCGQTGMGNCKEAQTETTAISYLDVRLLVSVLDALLP